jgi:hypothetical protein
LPPIDADNDACIDEELLLFVDVVEDDDDDDGFGSISIKDAKTNVSIFSYQTPTTTMIYHWNE